MAAQPKGRRTVHLAVPALIVAARAVVALWRIAPPPQTPTADGVATAAGNGQPDEPLAPLTTIVDLLVENSVGRQASLAAVTVREVTSPRTFWIGEPRRVPVFVVLDPDVKRFGVSTVTPGMRVTLVGLVRPAPVAQRAIQQWQIDNATADALIQVGTYLHATEIHAPAP
jgi:hypothetical protein